MREDIFEFFSHNLEKKITNLRVDCVCGNKWLTEHKYMQVFPDSLCTTYENTDTAVNIIYPLNNSGISYCPNNEDVYPCV